MSELKRLCPKAFWTMFGGIMAAVLLMLGFLVAVLINGDDFGLLFQYQASVEEVPAIAANVGRYVGISVSSVLAAAYITFIVPVVQQSAKPTGRKYQVVLLVLASVLAVYFGFVFAFRLVALDAIRIDGLYAEFPMEKELGKAYVEGLQAKYQLSAVLSFVGILVNVAIIIGVVLQRLFDASGKRYYGKTQKSSSAF